MGIDSITGGLVVGRCIHPAVGGALTVSGWRSVRPRALHCVGAIASSCAVSQTAARDICSIPCLSGGSGFDMHGAANWEIGRHGVGGQ